MEILEFWFWSIFNHNLYKCYSNQFLWAKQVIETSSNQSSFKTFYFTLPWFQQKFVQENVLHKSTHSHLYNFFPSTLSLIGRYLRQTKYQLLLHSPLSSTVGPLQPFLYRTIDMIFFKKNKSTLLLP